MQTKVKQNPTMQVPLIYFPNRAGRGHCKLSLRSKRGMSAFELLSGWEKKRELPLYEKPSEAGGESYELCVLRTTVVKTG